MSKDEHLSKAENNRRFAYALKPLDATLSGWTLTVLFYSALHYVEAYNATIQCHFINHNELNRHIEGTNSLAAIHDDYRDLANFSWNARYQAIPYGVPEIEEAKEFHSAVRKHIYGLLGLKAGT
jgi:hypothetical protein